ncbi:Pectinesterase [Macleaya cordata]|uniref:Pectinesterase n=1 Tax=Macleaya cordata TaxID=56857 RepID=A0A200QPK7_MACCD|nr:Pectinesterase [Macleaya cordata]
MNAKMTQYVVPATSLKSLLLLILHLVPVISINITPIPSDPASLESWASTNILPFSARATDPALDPTLVTAEKNVVVIKVRQDGSGQFKTVTEAVNSIPEGNTKRTIVWIGAGVYKEKITVNRKKPFVTFYGEPADMPKLTFDGTAAKYGTVDSASVIMESDYFMAVNIIFENSSPEPDGKRVGAQAEAVRISGDKSSFYNCKFIGFQDTLCDDRGNHFFKDCEIQGTVDFIFGNGKSLYLKTELRQLAKQGGVISAHAREKEEVDSGYNFVHCTVSGPGAANTHLGRAWKSRATVTFIYSFLGPVVNPEGWSDFGNSTNDGTIFFGEYMNRGPGSNTNSRNKFTKLLTDQAAKPFLDINYIKGSTWLLAPPQVK